MDRLRTVIRSPKFQNELSGLGLDAKTEDGILEALEWALAKTPTCGKPTSSPKYWAMPLRLHFNPYKAVVCYSFNDDTVTLVDIVFSGNH